MKEGVKGNGLIVNKDQNIYGYKLRREEESDDVAV
jgi:hypothetical protein